MGMFDGIEDATVSKSGQYFKPGNFLVELKAVKQQDSATAPGKQFFIIETQVLESSNPDIPVGNERSQVITMGQTMSLPNVKAFMAAVSGVDPNADDVNAQVEAYWMPKLGGQHTSFDKICELVVGPANPLAGLKLRLVCEEIQTKGTKQPFTKHLWQPRDIAA
jgi:hypothetical protein